ncbi:MAG: RidA family protein [Acidimicrobiia bacterium]|nr:RidA family protein [Acidimicrobiia bacterium]
MTNSPSSPDSVHPPAGQYSHAVAVSAGSTVVFLAGQIGLDPEGNASGDFAEQADQAYRNVAAILDHHGLGMADVVKMTHYLTDSADLQAYSEVRSRWLGAARPASTLLVVSELARPDLRVEVEVVAATSG